MTSPHLLEVWHRTKFRGSATKLITLVFHLSGETPFWLDARDFIIERNLEWFYRQIKRVSRDTFNSLQTVLSLHSNIKKKLTCLRSQWYALHPWKVHSTSGGYVKRFVRVDKRKHPTYWREKNAPLPHAFLPAWSSIHALRGRLLIGGLHLREPIERIPWTWHEFSAHI